MRWVLHFLALAVALCPNAGPAQAQDAPIIHISAGALRGERGNGLVLFKGIPYAAPPVGDRRWRAPASAEPWQDVREATRYGNDCVQTRREWDAARAGEPMGEDCLTLNIWAPADPREGGAPVMLWIHGGSFTAGSGAQAVYDGSNLARRGVVVVTFNYRLGRFGFFAHPALTREANGSPTGNWGLMDQIAALSWVRDNIRAFGGNPDNVTIFGESAGGGSVNQLMLSPPARGLFHRAISQSGGGRDRLKTLAQAEAIGVAFARRAGIEAEDDVAALRAIPAETVRGNITLLNTEADTFSGPFADGRIIVGDADLLFAAGRQAPVPYLAGANSDELAFLPDPLRGPFTAMAAAQLGESAAAIRDAYGSPEAFERHFVGDAMFVEPARFLAGAAAANGSFLYHFDYVPEGRRGEVFGAAHAAEVPFVFGNLDELGVAPTQADQRMADLIGDYWIAFAQSGDPSGAGRLEWPRFRPDGSRLNFGAGGARPESAASPALDALARRADATRPAQ